MPLTQKAIDAEKPRKKTFRLYDDRGMYLEVSPAGGRWWRLKYRVDGKEKRVSLGTYPDVTLKAARKKRDDARALVANGVDPSVERKESKRRAAAAVANSFESVAREWMRKNSNVWTERHTSDVKRRLEGNLLEDLGDKPISEITPTMLLATVRKVEGRGAHDLAHRILGVASQVFRYGVATGRCESDPSRDLRGALTPHQPTHQNAIKPDELPALVKAIDGYDTIGDLQTKLALQLLALTFVRTNELLGAKWTEFDDLGKPQPLWRIPAARMKKKRDLIVPLAPQTIKVLRQLKQLSGDSELVLPGRSREKPLSNNTLLFALYRLGYKGRMTGHGFRSVASTMLNEAGFRSDIIERQLAHEEDNAVRAAYNRAEYLPERTQMMLRWADMLDAARRAVR